MPQGHWGSHQRSHPCLPDEQGYAQGCRTAKSNGVSISEAAQAPAGLWTPWPPSITSWSTSSWVFFLKMLGHWQCRGGARYLCLHQSTKCPLIFANILLQPHLQCLRLFSCIKSKPESTALCYLNCYGTVITFSWQLYLALPASLAIFAYWDAEALKCA